MNGSRRIIPRSTVRISGSGRLKTKTWVVAMPGPETIRSAIRSRPIPVSLNRPSAPVVAAIVTSRLAGCSPRLRPEPSWVEREVVQALPEIAGRAIASLGDPAGDVAVLVIPDPGGPDIGPDDGPALEVDDPPFDRRPFLDERHHLLGRPVGPQRPLGPADAITRGRSDEPGKQGRVTVRRASASGFGESDRKPAIGPAGRPGPGIDGFD